MPLTSVLTFIGGLHLRVRAWTRRHPVLAAMTGAVVFTVAGFGTLWVTLPEVGVLRSTTPDTTAYMGLRLRTARQEGRALEIRHRPVPLARIPDHLELAVRVAEDATFYQHDGVDWYEVRQALTEALHERELPRGASTITQQLARNLYLSPEQTPWRKLRELVLALKLERRLSKRRILELYLNVIELGEGIFGVDAASRHYFGVPVRDLTPEESVELAATIPAPLEDNPESRTPRFRWRVELIARRLRARVREEAAPDTEAGGRDTAPLPPDTGAADRDTTPQRPRTVARESRRSQILRMKGRFPGWEAALSSCGGSQVAERAAYRAGTERAEFSWMVIGAPSGR